MNYAVKFHNACAYRWGCSVEFEVYILCLINNCLVAFRLTKRYNFFATRLNRLLKFFNLCVTRFDDLHYHLLIIFHLKEFDAIFSSNVLHRSTFSVSSMERSGPITLP